MNCVVEGAFSGLKKNGYGLILADPAWSWVSFSGQGSAPHRTADEPYKTMTIEELRALPVADLAAKDCVLIMWVIGSHLDQAIELGRQWGFTFKSDGFIWVKTGKHDQKVRPLGMGKWVRKQTEYTLIFSRGKPSRLEAGVRQLFETDEHVIYAPRREHSRKPDDQYSRCERLAAGPYLEMFARQSREGWDSWGDQASKFDHGFIPEMPGERVLDELDALLG
jgi:N6-adenosine-specific RNA methylase IME4